MDIPLRGQDRVSRNNIRQAQQILDTIDGLTAQDQINARALLKSQLGLNVDTSVIPAPQVLLKLSTSQRDTLDLAIATLLNTYDVADTGVGLPDVTTLVVVSNGQTVFTLPSLPIVEAKVYIKYGGLVHVQPADFTVSGTTLTWGGNPPTEIGDELVVFF